MTNQPSDPNNKHVIQFSREEEDLIREARLEAHRAIDEFFAAIMLRRQNGNYVIDIPVTESIPSGMSDYFRRHRKFGRKRK